MREIPKIHPDELDFDYYHKGYYEALQQWAEDAEKEIALEILAKDDLQERNELQFKQIKELKERIIDAHSYYKLKGAWNNCQILTEIFPALLIGDIEQEQKVKELIKQLLKK